MPLLFLAVFLFETASSADVGKCYAFIQIGRNKNYRITWKRNCELIYSPDKCAVRRWATAKFTCHATATATIASVSDHLLFPDVVPYRKFVK